MSSKKQIERSAPKTVSLIVNLAELQLLGTLLELPTFRGLESARAVVTLSDKIAAARKRLEPPPEKPEEPA